MVGFGEENGANSRTDADIFQAQMRGSSILGNFESISPDGSGNPVNRRFEMGIAAAVDGAISHTIRSLKQEGPWVDFCSGDGCVTAALYLTNGMDPSTEPLTLVDLQRITSPEVIRRTNPRIVTADIMKLDPNTLPDSPGVVTIIQPPDLKVLGRSLRIANEINAQQIVVFSSHNMAEIIDKLPNPMGYTNWGSSDRACRILTK